MEVGQPIYEIRVELLDVEPLIWRQFVVPGNSSLIAFHAAVQGAMGWNDTQVHSYEIQGKKYEEPDFYGPEKDSEYLDERKYILSELVKEGDDFFYMYSFGDTWRHLVKVERVFPSDVYFRGARCLAGKRACPPEDCGGPFNYPEFISILKNRNHPDHLRTLEWTGNFDPEVFSVSQATNLMSTNDALYHANGKIK